MPATQIDVTASSTATTVSLLFTLSPVLQLAADEVFEINGGFSANVTGSSRELTNVDLELQGSVGGNAFDFIEIGSNTLADSNAIDAGTPGPVSFGSALANLSTFALLWDLQGETGPNSSATVNSFQVTFDLRDPPLAMAPESAALPLLLSGLIGIDLLGMRRNRA